MKRRFNSHFNYVPGKTRHETPVGESQTIPGEARTIKQLIERLELGVPFPNKNPQFMDIDLEKIDHYFQQALDLVDYDELNERIQGTRDYIKQAQEEQARYMAAQKKKDDAMARDLEIKEAISKSKLNAE